MLTLAPALALRGPALALGACQPRFKGFKKSAAIGFTAGFANGSILGASLMALYWGLR